MVGDSPDSIKKAVVDAGSGFAGGLLEAVRRPVDGIRQLAGGTNPEAPSEQAQAPRSTVESGAHTFGSMVGHAAVFIGTSALLSKVPFAGRFASYATGGALGFLDPVGADQGLGTRTLNGLTGAATIGVLQHGHNFLPTAFRPTSALGQTVASSTLAGAFNVQADSLIKTGQFASVGETALGAATWAGTGLAFGAGARWLDRNRGGTERAPVASENARAQPNNGARAEQPMTPAKQVELPSLQIGTQADFARVERVLADTPLARLYADSAQSVARVESLRMENGKPAGGIATAVAVRTADGNLRFLSTDHLVKNAVDVTVFDRFGFPHKADVITHAESTDVSVLRLQNPNGERRFGTMNLSAEHPSAQPNAPYAAVGFPNGWNRRFVSVGTLMPTTSSRSVDAHFRLNGEAGLCGSPICNVESGRIAGLYKNADAASNDISGATTAPYLMAALNLARNTEVPRVSFADRHLSLFRLADRNAARADLEGIFGEPFWAGRRPDFFHSRVRMVNDSQLGTPLALRVQLNPENNAVLADAIALGGRPLTPSQTWPGTDIPIASARLAIKLDHEGRPIGVRSFNDPLNVLPQAFVRPYTSYLPFLTPLRSVNLR